MDSPIPPNDIGHQLALSPTHFTTENQASSPEKALPSPDSSCHLSWEDSQDRNRDQTTTTKWLPERLTRLIQLASQTPDIAESDSNVLHDCLDTIESLLLDPRPNITREIIRCRPSSPHSMPKLQPPRPQLVSSSSALTSDRSMAFTTSPTQTSEKSQHSQLEELRDDVAMLSVQLNQRRNEAFQIYGLLSQEREKLASKISELETEIREL
ncbi:hypothetical protein ARAM_007539 [Aspergillus rambellii]|uniref:Uncharacterized protein n=3 Tax=Aspergillus subgen. Nidulantes TaxID=2720870 RepID=A0A0F8UHM6_9EURO|nr:hypothetical protein ARAM_007539 [Aspergillus rambellii]